MPDATAAQDAPRAEREASDIEQLAIALRQAAFPGAPGWAFCSEDVRNRWVAASTLAYGWIEAARNVEEQT